MAKKDTKDIIKKAAALGGAGYALSRNPLNISRKAADYMHNYLEGYYGKGITKFQKSQLMGKEALKAGRRFAYNSLLDPIEVMAYNKTGIPPQLYRLHVNTEKQIADITRRFIWGEMGFKDAKNKIRNLEKQVHFKLTSDYSNAHMFKQKPQKALTDYASKYVEKSNITRFNNATGGKGIAKYAVQRWGLPGTKGILFMKYSTPAWSDVVRGAQFDPRFYSAMKELKNFTGTQSEAATMLNRSFKGASAMIKDGKVVFSMSPRIRPNFDWGGFNAIGIWDKGDKIKIIATDKRDILGGFKGGGRNTINYVNSKEITITEAVKKIKQVERDPIKPKPYVPRLFDPAYRMLQAEDLRVGCSRNVLKKEIGSDMSKYSNVYNKLSSGLRKLRRSAISKVAAFLLRRGGLAGMAGLAGYELYKRIKDRKNRR